MNCEVGRELTAWEMVRGRKKYEDGKRLLAAVLKDYSWDSLIFSLLILYLLAPTVTEIWKKPP